MALDQAALTEEIVNETLGVLLKYRDDIQQVQNGLVRPMLERVAVMTR